MEKKIHKRKLVPNLVLTANDLKREFNYESYLGIFNKNNINKRSVLM